MFASIEHASFRCPACEGAISQVVVTELGSVRTAVVQGLHEGVGHTAALAGTTWVVRCGDGRKLHPAQLVVGPDKVVRQTQDKLLGAPDPGQGPPPGSSSQGRKKP